MFRSTRAGHFIKQALRLFRRGKTQVTTSDAGRLPPCPISPIQESQYSDPQNCKVEVVTEKNLTRDDTIIAIMGPTGSGKSAFVETATGISSGVGHTLESQTGEMRAVRVTCQGPRATRSVVLVDTPGFDDTHRSDLDILKLVSGWLKSTYENGLCLSGVLYLHRISDNRMAGTPLKNLEMFKKLCGENAYRKVILATTMWGSVKREVGDKRESELKEGFWTEMITKGSRALRFEDTRQSAWDILNCIIVQGPGGDATQIQKELVDQRRTLRNTKVGQYVCSITKRLVADLKADLADTKAMLKASDLIANGRLRNQVGSLQGRLHNAENDVDELDASCIGCLYRRIRRQA